MQKNTEGTYLLVVHTTIYVPLYNKLGHRVLLPIGWPLSSFFQLERFLIFSLKIHRNAHSDRLSCCCCLFIRNNTSLPKKHANPSNAMNDSFCCSHGAEHAPCILHSALNVCGKTLNTTRARQYRFCIRFADARRNPTRSLQPIGENDMLMQMCVYIFERKIRFHTIWNTSSFRLTRPYAAGKVNTRFFAAIRGHICYRAEAIGMHNAFNPPPFQ